jgi:hypothetical protein
MDISVLDLPVEGHGAAAAAVADTATPLFSWLVGGISRPTDFYKSRTNVTVVDETRNEKHVMGVFLNDTYKTTHDLALVPAPGTVERRELLRDAMPQVLASFEGRVAFFGGIILGNIHSFYQGLTDVTVAYNDTVHLVDFAGNTTITRLHLRGLAALFLVRINAAVSLLVIDDCNQLTQIVAPGQYAGEVVLYECRRLRSLVNIGNFKVANCDSLFDVTSFDDSLCKVGPGCTCFPIQVIQSEPQFLTWELSQGAEKLLRVSSAVSNGFKAFYDFMRSRLCRRIPIPKIDETCAASSFVFLGEPSFFLLILKDRPEWEKACQLVDENQLVGTKCMTIVHDETRGSLTAAEPAARFRIYTSNSTVAVQSVGLVNGQQLTTDIIATLRLGRNNLRFEDVVDFLDTTELPTIYCDDSPLLILSGDIPFTPELQRTIMRLAKLTARGCISIWITDNSLIQTFQLEYEHVENVVITACPALLYVRTGCFLAQLNVNYCENLVCIETHRSQRVGIEARNCPRLQCVAGGISTSRFFNCENLHSLSQRVGHRHGISVFPGCPRLPVPDVTLFPVQPGQAAPAFYVYHLPLLADGNLAALDDNDERKREFNHQRQTFELLSLGLLTQWTAEISRQVAYPQALGTYVFHASHRQLCFVGTVLHPRNVEMMMPLVNRALSSFFTQDGSQVQPSFPKDWVFKLPAPPVFPRRPPTESEQRHLDDTWQQSLTAEIPPSLAEFKLPAPPVFPRRPPTESEQRHLDDTWQQSLTAEIPQPLTGESVLPLLPYEMWRMLSEYILIRTTTHNPYFLG